MNKNNERFKTQIKLLRKSAVTDWGDIAKVLAEASHQNIVRDPDSEKLSDLNLKRGIAIITFDYGVDGVSIEISKYAKTLEALRGEDQQNTIHLIGADFRQNADALFPERWQRFVVPGINGWSKWDDGKWFSALFFEDMPMGSEQSQRVAQEIFKQSIDISVKLGDYILAHDIDLLVPVNVNSNPGNLAYSIAIILVSEMLGLYVINSNHDYYWDDGKAAHERQPGELAGVRDHFFRNADNLPFFDLFQSVYPWNGERWIQANINTWQSERLMGQYGFRQEKIYELPTSVGEGLFAAYGLKEVRSARLRMACILSDGKQSIEIVGIDDFVDRLDEWMQNQQPIVVGQAREQQLELTSPDLIYLLQPTRIISRKRIERDVTLIGQLLSQGRLCDEFLRDENRQMLLHISGPAPLEHQADLQKITTEFQNMLKKLPSQIAKRIFIAFSVGQEQHVSFKAQGFERLGIRDVYRMASAVLFPSESEGRGLPIIEAAAVGVPIICSRYSPEVVFAQVVGEGLDDDLQIRYTLFPEGEFSSTFIESVADLLLNPGSYADTRKHNQQVIRKRYSASALTSAFETLIERVQSN